MKNLKLLIILAVLILIAGTYYFSNSKGSLNLKNSSFEIKSVEGVTKIQISTPDENLLLEKEHSQWKVNGKYLATDKSVGNFLLAINRIAISTPVSNAEKEQVASILTTDGLIVEIFKNNKTVKKYYVSKPAMNKSKTYMMMHNSSEPFVVRIPSFKGLVSNLFIIDENYWRDKTVFNYQPQNISCISVEFPVDMSKSFRVINYNNGTFAMQELNNNKFVKEFNVDKVARYFTYFQRIVFDQVEKDLSQTYTESILHSKPFIVIAVEDIQGLTNKISLYRKTSENEFDEFGDKAQYDYNRAYATFNDNKELVIVQYFIFDPLFKEIDYFR